MFPVHIILNSSSSISVDQGSIMEIVPGVHWIDGVSAQCYLVDDTVLTLIDTGFPWKKQRILRYITETLRKNPSDLKAILLTHCDIDHIGNAAALRRITGASIAAHPQDADVIAGTTVRPAPKGGMRFLFKLQQLILRVRSFHVDKTITDGDTISGLTVLHMPGHTQGSIALYDPRRKVLFIGDTLGCHDGVVYGPSKQVTWDMEQAYHSIEKLQNLDFTVMLSGHGEPLKTDAAQKVREFLTKKLGEQNRMVMVNHVHH
jgi:glyoxylase-like metal-dependent hydrolase (beta-lactamase superfamily II)